MERRQKMAWKFDDDRPIYTQLLEQIEMKIICGEYPPGSKMPSVRELASQAAVNPNTMQRALQELERNGLVETQRTAGRIVTENRQIIQNAKNIIAREKTVNYVRTMSNLGISKAEIIGYIDEIN